MIRQPSAIVRPAKPSAQSLRSAVLQCREQEQESSWAMARAITAFVDAEAWQHIPFGESKERTREAWIKEDLHGSYTPPSVRRIVQTMRAIDKLPQPERAPFYAAPFWNAVEALASESPAEAVALVSSGKTQVEIRHTVKARRERKAADGGEVAPRPESWVSLELNLPADLAKRWEGALNLVRFRLHRQTPALPMILEALIVDLEQNFERDTDPVALRHTTSDGVTLAWTAEDVAAGKIRCRMCGSYDASSIDPHHAIPRSRELACCGVDHPKVIELLCRRCHSSIKDSAEGSWAVWAARWGHGDLVKAHGGHFDQNELIE